MKAYKYRFCPTALQRAMLAQHFGAGRWIWNWALALRSHAYKQGGASLNYVELNRRVTRMKRTTGFAWLKDTPTTVLTQKLIDQDKAFSAFFAQRAKYPRFRKRSHQQSIRFQLDQRQIDRAYAAGELLKLPRLGALKLKWSRLPPADCKPKMVTVSLDCAGDYWVSFAVDEVVPVAPATNKAVGIDLGIKDVVVSSDGYKSGAPKHLYAAQQKLKHEQRALSRKRKGSGRWHRQRLKVAVLHRKVQRQRDDFLHKVSTQLVNENQVIAIEDLNVKGMMKNHRLAKAIGDAGWHKLVAMLTYKAGWHGRDLLVIDRFAPSSKRCSSCGTVVEGMPLHIRSWQCDCGCEHDRDINAATNILYFATDGQSGSAVALAAA